MLYINIRSTTKLTDVTNHQLCNNFYSYIYFFSIFYDFYRNLKKEIYHVQVITYSLSIIFVIYFYYAL